MNRQMDAEQGGLQLEAGCPLDGWTKTLAVYPSLKTDASPTSLA